MEGRDTPTVLLLPNRGDDNFVGVFLAAAGCILRRGVVYDDRVVIEPPVGNSDSEKLLTAHPGCVIPFSTCCLPLFTVPCAMSSESRVSIPAINFGL